MLFDSGGAAGRPAEMVAAGRVTGTSSQILFEALAGVYDSLGFDTVADTVFRDLVIARVVERPACRRRLRPPGPGSTATRDAIEAYLTIVFTALAVARTGASIRAIVRQLRVLRSATIAINGTEQTFPPAIDPEQQALLDTLATDNVRH